MPVFRYKAYNADGKGISGELEALSLKEAASSLKSSGIFPKELSVAAGSKDLTLKRVSGFGFKRKVSLIELSAATRQIATLLEAGVALFEALDFLISEEKNRTLKMSLIDIKELVAEGQGFAKALSGHPKIFPEVYQRMVEAGEESGRLDVVLGRLADYLEAMAAVRSRVITAFIYPALMTVVGFAVLTFLLLFVMPKITIIFEDREQALPFITEILLGAVYLLKTFWPIIIIFFAAAVFAARRFIRTNRGSALKYSLMLKLPVMGKLLNTFYSASLAGTLGSLLESGVPLLKALDMTKRVLNQNEFTKVLTNSIIEVTEGGSLSKSFAGTVVPGLIVNMTAIGERSGKLDELLLRAGKAYNKNFETAVSRMLALVEPILILAMGVIVGFIVLAILLPIFELNQMVG